MPVMIPVKQAKQLVKEHVQPLPVSNTLLEQCVNRVLAGNVYSPVNVPAFEQSAMDGYALNFEGWKQHGTLTITGEMPAGADSLLHIQPGQAARIFTGAPLPAGADTVVMQEKIMTEGDQLIIQDVQLHKGTNVRPAGSEVQQGALSLAAGNVLTPAAIGFLAGTGIESVNIFASPSVAIIVTGNELQTPGQPLHFGQVYESNSYTLKAVLQQMNISPVTIYRVPDNPDVLEQTIQKALQTSQLLLLTGGVSVGSYDYVAAALQACGVKKVFHKVMQKPGKPLFFGMKDNIPVFGLPGNPSSVLTCFYQYVYPALRKMMGFAIQELTTLQLPLQHSFEKKAGLTHFLKGFYDLQGVTALQAQESYRMQSFAVSNCLISLPQEMEHFAKGYIAEVHLLP